MRSPVLTEALNRLFGSLCPETELGVSKQEARLEVERRSLSLRGCFRCVRRKEWGSSRSSNGKRLLSVRVWCVCASEVRVRVVMVVVVVDAENAIATVDCERRACNEGQPNRDIDPGIRGSARLERAHFARGPFRR